MPGKSISPCSACFTFNRVERSSNEAIQLLCPGARCCTTTMLLGKLIGSPLNTRERAARPPADAPRATSSKWRREEDNASADFLGLRAIGHSRIVEPMPLKKKIFGNEMLEA